MNLLTHGQFQKMFRDFEADISSADINRVYVMVSRQKKEQIHITFDEFLTALLKLLGSYRGIIEVFSLNDF
jgi:Ca2+-binding EF-hand superfamily protein